MKFCTCVFLLAIACYGQTNSGVAVFLNFESTPAPVSLALMQQETTALLAPAGITPLWRNLQNRNPGESFSQILMVKFKGACRPGAFHNVVDDLQPYGPSTMRLAATQTLGQTVLPFAEVECEAIRKIVSALPYKDRAKAIGQALGRVIAHELYHLLLQTHTHAHEGLAKAVLTWQDLLTSTFPVQELMLLSNTKSQP